MTSRRTVFANCSLQQLQQQNKHPHAGLWLDKFLTDQAQGDEEAKPATQLVKEVSSIGEPAGYNQFYNRWLNTLSQLGVRPRPMKINGRLAIGLGRASVIETGVTLHHTYGVPVIPGSSLKGLASTYADQYLANTLWKKGKEAHDALFGTTKTAGVVTFFDALPLPGQSQLLRPDVITVHHPDYYQGQNTPPADWDSPNPIPFLTVTGTFLVALQPAPGAAGWEEMAYGILGQAAAELGAGAKTSSGYGRFRLDEPIPQLATGTLLPMKVTGIESGDVELTFRDEQVMGMPAGDKNVYAYIPHDLVTSQQIHSGQNIHCVVVEIMDDEYDFIVKCRPAAKSEREAR